MASINDLFNRLEHFLSRPWFSLFSTLYLNFRTLKLKDAIRLPIYIYGKVNIVSLAGEISFENCKVKPGMVKLGRNTDKFFAPGKGLILLSKGCKIIFNGKSSFGSAYSLRLTNKSQLKIGEYVRAGSGVKIFCEDSIDIGKYSILTFNCQILDTNFHYTYNVADSIVRRNTAPIIIGAYNWIGNRSAIMKGTKTKDYTIVTTGSLLNKNYDDMNNEHFPMLAGCPARIISHGLKRIYSKTIETELRNKFNAQNIASLQLDKSFVDDLNLKGMI